MIVPKEQSQKILSVKSLSDFDRNEGSLKLGFPVHEERFWCMILSKIPFTNFPEFSPEYFLAKLTASFTTTLGGVSVIEVIS